MEHDRIQGYTPMIYDHDLTEESTKEQSKLFHGTIVNCVSYKVSSSLELRLRGTNTRNFRVEVIYYKQYDVDGDNWKSVVDFFELLQDLLWSELGGTWNSTVDYYVNQDAPPVIDMQTIGGRRCWVGRSVFMATKGI
jgi:hypothetical protein